MGFSARSLLLRPSGMSSLQQLLQEKQSTLMSAPILLITSKASSNENVLSVTLNRNTKSIGRACDLVSFTLAQQMGFRTVQSSIFSAIPTINDVDERVAMLSRVAASSIVAVGSGAAMDLAKAVAAKTNSIEQIILVPASHGAILATGSPRALLLDTNEETLVPTSDLDGNGSKADTTVVAMDEQHSLPETAPDAMYVCASIAMDALLRGDRANHDALDLLQRASDRLDNGCDAVTHEEIIEMLHDSGSLLSFGLDHNERSATLALFSALVPTIFPETPPLSFIRGLIPGLCQAALQSPIPILDQDDDVISRVSHQLLKDFEDGKIPKLEPSDESMRPAMDELAMQHVRSNQALWNCLDYPDTTLSTILRGTV